MTETPILAAFQAGWLAVEAFGLLRQAARYAKPAAGEIDPRRDFNFTTRQPTLELQLITALQRLKAVSAQVVPELPPPLPPDPAGLLAQAKQDLAPLWLKFDQWSNQVWVSLQASNPTAGQAFTCGGDLAQTFWQVSAAGKEKLADTLRSHRLAYIAERLGDLAPHLPEHAVLAIQHSLAGWGIGEQISQADQDFQKRLTKRLEAQVKVWRDLLFGLRSAESYLTARDRKHAARGALAASGGLVLLVGLAAWLAVLFLAGVGRSLMGSALGLAVDTTQISGDLSAYLSDWQNWSALLATISSVLAVLTGVVKGLSGWLWAFHQNQQRILTLRRIETCTYRSPYFRGVERAEEEQDSED